MYLRASRSTPASSAISRMPPQNEAASAVCGLAQDPSRGVRRRQRRYGAVPSRRDAYDQDSADSIDCEGQWPMCSMSGRSSVARCHAVGVSSERQFVETN